MTGVGLIYGLKQKETAIVEDHMFVKCFAIGDISNSLTFCVKLADTYCDIDCGRSVQSILRY